MNRKIKSMNLKFNIKSFRSAIGFMLVVLMAALPSETVQATHIVGGQLSYRVIAQNRVEITLIVRRDCALGDPEADFDNPAYINFFDFNGDPVRNPIYSGDLVNGTVQISLSPADTLDETLMSGCDVLLDPVCVQEVIYRRVINLNEHPSGGYKLAYQRCCRNSSLTNVIDPLNTGMTMEIDLSNEALQSRNHSAQLPEFPPIYACINQPYDIDQMATDADGDTLRYRLKTPFEGATMDDPYPTNSSLPPFTTIDWQPPYSLSNLLNTSTPLSIDPQTGLLTVTPDAIGQFLVSFCVDEIRNGRVFNTVCREFEVNARPCGDAAVACIDNDTDLQCDNLNVNYTSTCSDGDSVAWVFTKEPGFSDTIVSADPGLYAFPDTGTYCVQLWVTNTQSGCFDVDSTKVTLLNSGVEADMDILMLDCIDTVNVLVTDASTYDTVNPLVEITWDVTVGGSVISADSGTSIEFTLTENVTATICQYILVSNGCMVTNCETVDLNAFDLEFNADEVLCLNEERMITVEHAAGDDITITWEPNDIIIEIDTSVDGRKITVFTEDSIVTTLYFTATNEFGCSKSDSINITTAGERPDVSFTLTQECGSLTIQTVNTSSDTTIEYTWDFGDGTVIVGPRDTSHTYGAPGSYTVTLSGGIPPCDDSESMTIDVPIIDDEPMFQDTIVQCFGDSVELNPGGNSDWDYMWSPEELFSDPTAVNPKVLVDAITEVFVKVTIENGMNNCMFNDSITVVPVPDFKFDLDPTPGDITICSDGDTTITLTADADSNVVVTWKDGNGNVLATSDTLTVTLNQGLNEIIVMGVYDGIEECMKSESYRITVNQINLSFDITNTSDGTDMFCMPDSGKLVVIVDGPPGNYTYEWEPNYNVTGGLDSDTLCLFVDSSVTYCVTVTNTDLNCSQSACFEVEFSADVNLVLLDPDGVICIGDTIKLAATIDPEGMDCTYSWDVMGTIIGPDNEDTLCYVPSASHMAMVQVGCVGGCTASASVVVNVRDLSALISISAVDIPVEFDEQEVQLDVIGGDPDWTYFWEGPGIADEDRTLKDPVAIPGRGEHEWKVTVIDDMGCMGMATINSGPPTPVPCEHPFVFVPTAFSPDGANSSDNETVRVYGVEIERVIEFIIYNRWGQEVHRVNNVTNLDDAEWDGRFKGELLEADVFGFYLHVLCTDGVESKQQGNISLLR